MAKFLPVQPIHGDGGGDGDGDGGGDGGGAFVAESSGETVSREELWQRLAPPSSAGELLVQERLRNARNALP